MLNPKLFAYWVFFFSNLLPADSIQHKHFINTFLNTTRVSKSLDPDQARQNIGPDLGPNCLQMLSADGIGRQSVNGNLTVRIFSIHKTVRFKTNNNIIVIIL